MIDQTGLTVDPEIAGAHLAPLWESFHELIPPSPLSPVKPHRWDYDNQIRARLMKAGEQLAAMEVMAVDPIRRVLVPRFWGGVIAMPVLAAIFSMVGILGGWLVGVPLIGIDDGAFWSQMQAGVDIWKDIANGVVKSIVFGFAVTSVALFQGWVSRPTPEGVARATTRTVVVSSLTVLGLDFLLTALMFSN